MLELFKEYFGLFITWLAQQFHTILDFVGGLFEKLFNHLSNLIKWFLEKIVGFFDAVFNPILRLIDGFLYLIIKIASIVVLIIKNVVAIFKLVIALIHGFIVTVQSFFTYSPQPGNTLGVYNDGFNLVFEKINPMGFQVMAGILVVFVWFLMVAVILKVVINK